VSIFSGVRDHIRKGFPGMDDFLKYFEDKKFVRWVFIPDEQINAYWEAYLKDHPGEREKIKLDRTILASLKTKEAPGSTPEVYDLFYRTIRRIDRREKASRLRKVLISFSKYAAVALLFLAIGIGIMKWRQQSDFSFIENQLADVPALDHKDARLIMPDKSIVIKDKKSKIECLGDGGVIINQRDTIKGNSAKSASTGNSTLNELIVPYGKNSSIVLPDSTVAYLNAGSRLLYPAAFDGKTREVYLVGEGYFDVSHHPEKPFIVKTKVLDVKAIGTSFNVSSYPGDQVVEVVLVTGKVGIMQNTFNLFKRQEILLPNQLVSCDRQTGKTKIRQVDVENYITWHQGYMNFESEDLSRIVLKLERYYNINIKLSEPFLGLRKITGKLKLKEDKDKVLEVLASTSTTDLIKINEQNYMLAKK